MSRKTTRVYASQAVYIDPGECDSMIGFNITARNRMHAVVEITDCERNIKWYFGGIEKPLKKIDKAIEVLQQFKAAFIDAKKKFNKRKCR